MNNSFNLNSLTEAETNNTTGGCFAFDAGWVIGNLITGSFLRADTTAIALTNYGAHYVTAEQCTK